MPTRQVFVAIGAVCVALLAYGLYLQHVVGLEPCPMCIVQRYCLVMLAVCAWVAALGGKSAGPRWWAFWGGLAALFGMGGAFVAARQSFLQWYPPEVVTCGRDFYGMVESFPLQRAIPMIFKGSGDCAAIDWTFLGGTIANWSFICFTGLTLMLVGLAVRYWWNQNSRTLRRDKPTEHD